MLLSTFAVFSCSDKDNEVSASADRLMRPQFRTRYTVSAGSSDPDLCAVRNLNSIFLSWSIIQDAEAYQLRISTEQKVNKGEEAWENPENVLIDTFLDILIFNMNICNSKFFNVFLCDFCKVLSDFICKYIAFRTYNISKIKGNCTSTGSGINNTVT